MFAGVTIMRIKRYVSDIAAEFDYNGVRNRACAVLLGRGLLKCKDCGFRLCTCDKELPEFKEFSAPVVVVDKQKLRAALELAGKNRVCVVCGWRACTCNKTLDEWGGC